MEVVMAEKFDIKTREIEFKYLANDVKLTKFFEWVEKRSVPTKMLEVGSWDVYYSGKGLPFEFIRSRQGPEPQLTIKMKLDDNSNQNRFELNIPLGNGIKEWMVSKLAGLLGFKENFRVFKQCWIYWFNNVDVVYYIVFDKNMNEKARIIEIEACQDHPFESEEEAWAAVRDFEATLAEMDIFPANKLKRSMWDMFKKED